MNEELEKAAREIIEQILYITIATAGEDGKPWNTPVYAAYDEKYTFYWSSSPEAQHSKNITRSGNAFMMIYDSTQAEGTGLGVYIQAHASEVHEESEIIHALKYCYGRKHKSPKSVADFVGPSPRRIYKAVPQRVWVNTYEKVDDYPIDKRVEIKLH